MRLKKALSAFVAAAMAASCITVPALAEGDYGTVTTNSDGSITLNFGQDSITQSAHHSKEAMVTDTTYNVLRADYFQTDGSGEAVLTLPSVDLNGTGYTKVDVTGAVLNSMAMEIKVGDTSV
ncbi:MAG: hypothetical protein ACI38A_05470, partial [Candidatus Ornithomonoglobus sp.]